MRVFVRALASLALLLAPAITYGSEADWSGRTFEFQGPGTHPVIVLEAPAAAGDGYAITGQVAYDGVEGDAYLEMWSQFPDGSRYFSRTLAGSGSLAKLRGSSPERAFALPFQLTPGAPRPTRLEVNLVLPGAGRVTLRGLRFEPGAPTTAAPGAWWSDEAAGWIGGGAGSALGLLGALVGTLSSLGRGRRFVMGTLFAMAAGGFVALAACAAALASGQPYAVWYPLALLGILGPVLGLSLRGTVSRRFEALEAR
jgi:hypothetical protein